MRHCGHVKHATIMCGIYSSSIHPRVGPDHKIKDSMYSPSVSGGIQLVEDLKLKSM